MPLLKVAVERGGVANFLAETIKGHPGMAARVKVSPDGSKLTVEVGKAFPAVKSISFWDLDKPRAPFEMTLKSGEKGWGWDAMRRTFNSLQNDLRLDVVFDGKRDPEAELRGFVQYVLKVALEKANRVWDGEKYVPWTPPPKASPTSPEVALSLPRITPPPEGWNPGLRRYYRLFEELFRDTKNVEGLEALDAFADLGSNLKTFGSARLSIRFRGIENAINESRGRKMIDSFGDAFDEMVDSVVEDDEDDEDDYDYDD